MDSKVLRESGVVFIDTPGTDQTCLIINRKQTQALDKAVHIVFVIRGRSLNVYSQEVRNMISKHFLQPWVNDSLTKTATILTVLDTSVTSRTEFTEQKWKAYKRPIIKANRKWMYREIEAVCKRKGAQFDPKTSLKFVKEIKQFCLRHHTEERGDRCEIESLIRHILE